MNSTGVFLSFNKSAEDTSSSFFFSNELDNPYGELNYIFYNRLEIHTQSGCDILLKYNNIDYT